MESKLKVSKEIRLLIQKLHPQIKKKIKTGLQDILEKPESGKYLKDELAGLQSYRVSKFRIIYRKSSNIIELITVGPRKTIYRETAKLIKKNPENL